MNKHFAYLKAVVRHKWFVFLACLQWNVPLLSALIHDWDKFSPEMWLPYADYFYGPNANKRDASGAYIKAQGQKSAFDYAWNGHQKRNKHHWQYWVLFEDSGAVFPLPMPERARREMLADWFGAGRAYNKDWTPLEPRKWYEKNKAKMQLHPDTRMWIEAELLRCELEYLDAQVSDPTARSSQELREPLADISHDIWAHWTRWQFSVCTPNEDGSLTIPASLVERWKRQMETPYDALSEREKDSDREQADKILRSIYEGL